MTEYTNKFGRLSPERSTFNVQRPTSKKDRTASPNSQFSVSSFKYRVSRFTLTELLVVIGIMALIMYVVLPSFAKLAKGGGVEYSASNLVGRLGITRGTAVGKNMYAALLLPEYKSTDGTRHFPSKYLYSANRICYVTNNSGTYNFLAWVPNETWEFLPMGTVIFRANDNKDFFETPTDYWNGIQDDSDSGTPPSTHYSVVNNVNCSKENWSALTTDYDDMDNVRAIIFSPSGKVMGGERYVKIGEGVPPPSGALANSNLTNKQNWVNVKIDQYTGRITYGDE